MKKTLVLLGVLLFFNTALAEEDPFLRKGDLEINEIMYDPGSLSDADGEWLEVENQSSESVEFLELVGNGDEYETPLKLCKKDGGSCKAVYADEPEFDIGKEERFVIAKDKDLFDGSGYLVLESSFSLTNSAGSSVCIFFGDEEIDCVEYDPGCGASGDDKSLQKQQDGDFCFAADPTPGEANVKKEEEETDEDAGDVNEDEGSEEEQNCGKSVVVSELFPSPLDDGREWVEIYNKEADEVDVSGWTIMDKANNKMAIGKSEKNKVDAEGYFVVELESRMLNDSSSEELYLIDGCADRISSVKYEGARKGESFAMNKEGDYFWTKDVTPGEENIFAESSEGHDREFQIYFNEIMTNPEGADGGKEWIEFYNPNKEKVSLEDWQLENSGKKISIIGGFSIGAGSLAVLKLPAGSFYVRNSNETLSLLSPSGALVDVAVLTESAGDGISWSRTKIGGDEWAFSRKSTPGKKNSLNHSPKISVNIGPDLYKNTPIIFDASKTVDTDGDSLKFKWNFGDDRYSYLPQAKHLYENKGEYRVLLTVSDGSSEAEREIKIKVGGYGKRPVSIVGLSPNPAGSDSGKEWIEVMNLYNKKLNLRNWKISSGREEDLLRGCVIESDIVLYPWAKTKILSSVCNFFLPNETGLVRLEYPDGEKADEVAYQKDDIAEDEIYAKNAAGIWGWSFSAYSNGRNAASAKKVVDSANVKNSSIGDSNKQADVNLVDELGEFAYQEDEEICLAMDWLIKTNWKRQHDQWINLMGL